VLSLYGRKNGLDGGTDVDLTWTFSHDAGVVVGVVIPRRRLEVGEFDADYSFGAQDQHLSSRFSAIGNDPTCLRYARVSVRSSPAVIIILSSIATGLNSHGRSRAAIVDRGIVISYRTGQRDKPWTSGSVVDNAFHTNKETSRREEENA
jgi:hypothetical protein